MGDNMKNLASLVMRSLLMKMGIGVFGLFVVIIGIIIIIIAAVLGSDMGEGGGTTGGGKTFPDEVLLWQDDIEEEMAKQSLDIEYLEIMLAILYTESKGNVLGTNGDIFQASESKCGEVGCITDPLESIEQAVKHFKTNVSEARDNMEVAVASYNFGNGFATWTQKNHENEWSLDIAIEFSAHMMNEVDNPDDYTCSNEIATENDACYGDIHYVNKIMSFMTADNESGTPVEFDGELDFPVLSVYVTSEYGDRMLNGKPDVHNGLDLRCSEGLTPIISSGDGKIVHDAFTGTYGNVIIVEHENDFFTLYAHMSFSTVSKGDSIRKGQEVGICGGTGGNYAPHLHFETKTEHFGGFINPRNFLDFPPKGEYK